MRYLGIDVGTRRSGAAFADSEDGILFSLETINHSTEDELVEAICQLVLQKQIDEVVLGYPLLPSGEPGMQAETVSALSQRLTEASVPHSLCDERYTSFAGSDIDKDAAAACEILSVWLNMNK